MSIRITVQIFDNGKAIGEGVCTVHEAFTEQDAVNKIFKHVRIDQQYRFLGSDGFIIPTDTAGSHLLFNGGKA